MHHSIGNVLKNGYQAMIFENSQRQERMVHSSGVGSLQCLLPRNGDFIAPFCLICKLVLLLVHWDVDSNAGDSSAQI